MKYKVSKYNVDFFEKKGEVYFFNTLHATLSKISQSIANFLKKEIVPSDLSDSEIAYLLENKLICSEKDDELKIYALRRKIFQCNGERTHIFLTLTHACNCRCVYCFQGKAAQKGVMKPQQAKAVRIFVDKMVSQNSSKLLQIDFFGGEPFLCMNLVKEEIAYYQNYAKSKNIALAFRFYTNGTLITEELASYLATLPIKDLQITLDGEEEQHNKQRPLANKKNSFLATVNGLKLLKKYKVPYIIRINITENNADSIENLLNTLNNIGLEGSPLAFYPVQNMTEASCSYHGVCKAAKLKKLMPHFWISSLQKGFKPLVGGNVGYLYCSASNIASAVLDYEGNVHKCALLQERPDYKIGHLREDGSFIGPNAEYYRWMERNPLNNLSCCKCKMLPICGGGCGGCAVTQLKDYNKPSCGYLNEELLKSALLIRTGLIKDYLNDNTKKENK